MIRLLRDNWFLLILLLALLIGFYSAGSLRPLTMFPMLNWSFVAMTMFAMAWPVEFRQLSHCVSRPLAPLLAVLLNLVGIPLLVWPLALWIGGELGMGMMVAAAAPSTLATAAVWTRRAGGDDGVPMVVTILTNGSCFLVMPMWIYIQSGKSVESSILTNTVLNLLFFVVLPIVLAQLLRLNRNVAVWATDRRALLSTLAMIGILAMVLIGAVNMGLSAENQSLVNTWTNLALVAFLMGAVHILVFWSGLGLSRILGLSRPQQIGVGFSGSQKTLMTGLSVCISLGVSIVPIIFYHSIQLTVDTLFANQLRASNRINEDGKSKDV